MQDKESVIAIIIRYKNITLNYHKSAAGIFMAPKPMAKIPMTKFKYEVGLQCKQGYISRGLLVMI